MLVIRNMIVLLLLMAAPVAAQMPEPGADGAAQMLPPLTGPQKRILMLIAREAVEAALEGRMSRQATVEPRLAVPQPLVVSLYVDGELRGRTWRLKPSQPLYLDVRDLTHEAITQPREKNTPLPSEELARAEIGLAALGPYARAEDDRDVPAGAAVLVFSGFTEAVGIPGDVTPEKIEDLLSFACARAGLRPNIWLLPQTTIFYSHVDVAREHDGH